MAEITAAMVKALRDQTGQSMMECKKALAEADGDLQGAQDILRKRGLATAEKKSGRATAEGLVAIQVSADRTSAAMIEVRCETDFCARNGVFRDMVASLAERAAAAADGPVEATDEMNQAVQACLAKIGENMSYARGVKITAPRVGTYLHHNSKVGVVVGVDGQIEDQVLTELCQHIAFHDPMSITVEDIPADFVAKEKEIAIAQAMESGKPKEIAEKIVAGKMKKALAKNALMEQPFVRDESKTVKQVLGGVKVTALARFAVGVET
ncbi:MAG TPA: translation elongation factor Ts [Phycisphaerae bacterium]|nr:translation elongation factor Ts [Phycisphaerae bacterium]HUT60251.1 translation elongation factor Ts [Phycisphaerae bacterium]